MSLFIRRATQGCDEFAFCCLESGADGVEIEMILMMMGHADRVQSLEFHGSITWD